MAFSSTLTIADEANAAQTFVENERSGKQVRRINSATTLALPVSMVINHNTQGTGEAIADRHLIQLTKAIELTSGTVVNLVVNFTVLMPRGAVLADAQELVGTLINFLIGTDAARTLANLDNLLLGES